MKNFKILPLLLVIGALPAVMRPLRAAPQQGATIARQGNGHGAPACMSCHGANGEGNAASGYPRLAGLDKQYIAKQLQDFRQGSRNNPVMQPIARALTPQQINAVAEYYSELRPPLSPARPAAAPAVLERGRKLAIEGNWSKGMPACFACHGANGMGVAPHFPPLTEQNAAYIASQLTAWQTGARKNDPQGLMKAVATKLDKADIQAVSAFLATLGSKPDR